MLPEFHKWPSIQRLSSETIYITEKIDGTNGVIHVTEDGKVFAGSRERWLTLEDGNPPPKQADNFGFAQWVYDRRKSLVNLGPGTHYGEFYGAGIQRRYGLSEKRWASFEYWDPRPDLKSLGVDTVPVLFEGPYDIFLFGKYVQDLIDNGSTLVPGFMKPEGIVITFKNMRTAKFKKLCENDQLPFKPDRIK